MAPVTKSRGPKPSKVVKPKKINKHSTPHSRNHRFQGFNERIARLKIDPIRRRRNANELAELDGEAKTYLGRALEEWRDLNLSQNFSLFAREITPLCDSLPVVLHNEDKIMDLLIAYVEKSDALSMEPLLALMAHFAHDLDTRFEKHFERAVATITAVAAQHPDPAPVEWSFTCLAWLFKYLSRLLAPDLRPLYDLMSPYMGKESHKPFVIRFAAESLSFLVRKAAATYDRDPSPLDNVIEHILNDVVESSRSRTSDIHSQGVMTLLTEAIKGVQNGIHSSGIAVMKSILKTGNNRGQRHERVLSEIVCGTLVSVIHHTNSTSFKPLVDTIISDHIRGSMHVKQLDVRFASDVLFTIISVRKGTRIADWKPVVATVIDLVDYIEQFQDLDCGSATSLMSVVAVTMQSTTIDVMLPAISLIERLRRDPWTTHFLKFCDMFARLGKERFQSFVLPQFQRFVLEQWKAYGESACSLLPRLSTETARVQLKIPASTQIALLDDLDNLLNGETDGDETMERYASANALLTALPHLELGQQQFVKLRSLLSTTVAQSVNIRSGAGHDLRALGVGACFNRLLNLDENHEFLVQLWPLLCSASETLVTLPGFWSNLLHYIKVCPPIDFSPPQMSVLEESLLQTLASPSHEIRESGLAIINRLYMLQDLPVPEALAAAITIESTPLNLDTARSISMNIRRLSSGYADVMHDKLLRRAIPTYCFGILQFRLAQAWEDAVVALSEICKTSAGEETMITLAHSWLDDAPDMHETHSLIGTPFDINSDGFLIVSDFECSNLARITAISKQVFETSSSGWPSRGEQFRIDNETVPMISENARSQALRIFAKMPGLAEKRSRVLVPVLLKWAGKTGSEDEHSADGGHRWSRKDQKAMLSIIAQFTNPRVLYRSADVHSALLSLCANGDLEIQESALKALFAWKEPAINQYQEHLVNLLDEARFRDEISVFLQDAEEEQAVRPEHQEQLMPVLLRLLYGRAVAGGKHGQASRRKAIFVALSRFGPNVLGLFVDITMAKLYTTKPPEDTNSGPPVLTPPSAPLRQQLGMLNMLNELLETLGSELEPFGNRILDAAVACTVSASKQLDTGGTPEDLQNASLLRSIRQTGVQSLFKVFDCMKNSDFTNRVTVIMQELVAPRLDKFAAENAQSISGMLRLVASWSASPATARYLSSTEGTLLDHVADLLREHSAKDEVRIFVLQNVLDNLTYGGMDGSIMQPYVSRFVQSIGSVLAMQPSKDVLDACIESFTQLASRITDSDEAEGVVAVCSDLLTKPNKIVSPWTKTDLLKTLLTLVDHFQIKWSETLYHAICGLFSRIPDPKSRVIASDVLVKLSKNHKSYEQVASICAKMNAHSRGSKLDEPDHHLREQGFSQIYQKWEAFTFQQWLPLVHNCFFFIRDADDLVNRSSAAQALELFVKSSKRLGTQVPIVLLPGIERGLQESSELVRVEYVRLLGRVVQICPEEAGLEDLVSLTVGGDDEASIFANVLHIQQHRRLRALRRLADEAHNVSSTSTSKYFLPLLEHFVFDQAEGDAGRTLADQTVMTIGALAKTLTWSAFRATFKRYVAYIKTKEDLEKTTLRLLGALVDALSQTPEAETNQANAPNATRSTVITRDFLPPLMAYIHQKDESTVDRRMPVAVTIVKLLLVLPEDELTARLPPVLTDISHVLRSRSQEARDQTRKTLAAILALIGPAYLGFMLKELRSALQRGYQLHVLSFTVHSLLVLLADKCQPGDLNHCLHDLTATIMDDIFGITGQEKDAEEYKSGMKEVKSSKSFDTMELLAKVTPITRLGQLIQPLRALLSERLDAKAIRKIDDLLIRLRKGIDQNPAADSRDMLIFCHEVVRQVYAEQAAPTAKDVVQDYKVRKYLITMDSANKSKSKGATTSQMYKLTSFALNLVRKVVRRHEDLLTPANMAGFLPMAGDSLINGQEEVKLSAMRLLATIIRVPIPDLDANAQVYVKEAVAMIKASSSTTTDSAKAALELITAIMRERRSVLIKDHDVALLLKTIKPDIDEPDRQGIIYKFIRSILGRKIVITEVYEIMDEVGTAMVTNPDRSIRESARGAYLHFVMDYPQGKDRWNKQAGFLVENLKYEHSAGRQSVMELLHQLLIKLGDGVIAQLGFTMFVALVPVQISDTDPACRDMAGILIGKLFERADDDQLKSYQQLLDKWMANDKKSAIQIAALQCWKLYLQARRDMPEKQRRGLRDRLSNLLTNEDVIVSEHLLQHILETFSVMIEVASETAFDVASSDIWNTIQQCLAVSNANAQNTASTLIGAYFSHLASSSARTEDGLAAIPMRGAGGLKLTAGGMRKTCRTSLRVFMTSDRNLNEVLTAQTVRNLAFLGRCFAANHILWRDGEDADAGPEDDDDADEDEGALPNTKQGSFSALFYLLNRLSYIVRQDTFSPAARTSAITAQQTILSPLPTAIFQALLATLLRPLYALTDPSIPQPLGDAHKTLTDTARELMEFVQKKLGPDVYMKALGEVRNSMQAKRQERRQKRRIDAVAAPERWAKEKKRKHEMMKIRKKEKGAEARGLRRGW